MPSAYDRYTSTQVSAFNPSESLDSALGYFRAHIEKFLPKDREARILDLGCGYGKNLYALGNLGYWNTFGIDISEEQIAYAREKLKFSNVECGDALPWLGRRAAEFDVILIADVLEHLPLDSLLELGILLRSALKANGKIIIQVPNGLAPMSPYVYGDLTHHRAFTVQSLRQFFLLSDLVPAGFYELPEYPHGLNSRIRSLLWRFIVRPAIAAFFRIAHGQFGDIYTANILAVATK